ncbi:MAG: PKD domain-containing protein [Actinobacteria bacterium]|nr:PKD domain-containing protein [Actinomycetota bacterium]
MIKNKNFSIVFILLIAALMTVFIQGCCLISKVGRDNSDDSSGGNKTLEPDINKELEVDHGIFNGITQNYRIGSVKIPGQAIDVDISGNYAYVTNDLGVVYIISIIDRAKPFVVGKCPDVDSANIIIAREDMAYVSYTEYIIEDGDYYTECGFKIIDISDKENPVIKGDYNTGEGNKKSVFGFFVEDNYAYLNTSVYSEDSESSSLEIVNISSSGDPFIEGLFAIEGAPSNLWIEGERAYLNTNYYDYANDDYTGESKFLIIDISDRSSPYILSSTDVPSNSWGIYIKENYAYLSSNRSDDKDNYIESLLQVIDISDEKEPALTGTIEIPGGAWEIDMAGDFVYISDLTGGIYTIDVSDDEGPYIAGRLNTGGTSYDITIMGNYGYIADGFEGLVIAGLSKEGEDPSSLALNGDSENMSPKAIIDIFADQVGGHYITGNPIIFSALNAFDPEGSPISYSWTIDGGIFNDNISLDHIFEKPGDYKVSLEVSDGHSSDISTINILVADINHPVMNMISHDFSVEIEYILTNNTDQALDDIKCLMRIPLSYGPYQEVNHIQTSVPLEDEIFDNHWNKILKFDIEGTLPPGESLSVLSSIDMTMYEFDYAEINQDLLYDADDPDLIRYTEDDLFIDSDNPEISELSRRLIGNEKSPIKIAGILYNYIAKNLYYDYERAEDREYEFMNASEILDLGKGVCSDYSILYTAMLRSVGIPSRLAAGIPVYVILYEPGKEIDVGHAWVEIKIPGYGWVPIDITTEESFWTSNYFLDIITEKGPGYIYEHSTMDWGSYYYDGFDYFWDKQGIPEVEQDFIFRIKDLEYGNILKD